MPSLASANRRAYLLLATHRKIGTAANCVVLNFHLAVIGLLLVLILALTLACVLPIAAIKEIEPRIVLLQ